MWTFECDKKQTGKQSFQFYQNIVKIVTDPVIQDSLDAGCNLNLPKTFRRHSNVFEMSYVRQFTCLGGDVSTYSRSVSLGSRNQLIDFFCYSIVWCLYQEYPIWSVYNRFSFFDVLFFRFFLDQDKRPKLVGMVETKVNDIKEDFRF